MTTLFKRKHYIILFLTLLLTFVINAASKNITATASINWEIGTITAATGLDATNTTRLRTVEYLEIEDYNGVSIDDDYMLTYFVYDSNKNYLGNGTDTLTSYFLGSGVGITTAELLNLYPNGSYFRIAFRAVSSSTLTLNDVSKSKIKFYDKNEEIEQVELNAEYKNFMSASFDQDGAIYNNTLFAFDGSSNCKVYDLNTKTQLASFTLDKNQVINPHANSVSFSSIFYDENDEFPLLYVNVYNNYQASSERKEGMCLVYRIQSENKTYTSKLVQAIKIGFVEDLELWKSLENNGDVRPYGNFVVDTDSNKLYAFVMRDKEKITRFFEFELPSIDKGTYNDAYGCNELVLDTTDIKNQFDTEYFNYLQGCCYNNGNIYSLEGFGGSSTATLRIVNLNNKSVVKKVNILKLGITNEPEMISFDNNGKLYYGVSGGSIYELTIKPDKKVIYFDDHIDITGKDVEIVNKGTPTSYKVGYGVADKTLDEAVLSIEGNKLVATGIGTGEVIIDGVVYEYEVVAAPISMLLLIGQSNMQGSEGDANQSIICDEGVVYATYGDRYTMTVNNATNFAPSSLTGDKRDINVNGNTNNLSGYPVYSLNAEGAGKPGPDSGFAYEWAKVTNEKVWVINAAHGGSSITTWQKTGENYKEALLLFNACKETMKQEIAAGHYVLSHMGYYWCQGCTDASQTAKWYVEKYLTMHENLKKDFSFDHDNNSNTENKTFEFGNIVLTLAGNASHVGYRKGTYETRAASYFTSFEELEMRGQRVAQLWMAANKELKDINVVCNIGDSFVNLPNGTNGVIDYFEKHYENGIVDYQTQVTQKASWYQPTTPKQVKDSIHYNQIGYNEVGIESVRNTMYLMGYLQDPNKEITVDFVNWTGFENVDSITSYTAASSSTLVVPIVKPCYRYKEVEFSVTDGFSYEYFDLYGINASNNGILKATTDKVLNTVTIQPKESEKYFWQYNGSGFSALDSNEYSKNNLNYVSGTFASSAISNGILKLDYEVVLLHNRPWEIEMNMKMDTGLMFTLGKDYRIAKNPYLFKSNATKGLIAFGLYNTPNSDNYGAVLDNDITSSSDYHVVTIKNKVNIDGSNEVSLYVDNVYYSIMNNYFIGATNQNSKGDWLNGVDIIFDYFGTVSHPIVSSGIEYIYINENTNDYESSYQGKVISIMGDSISTYEGYIPTNDGFNLNHSPFYPNNVITNVNQTWWYQVINGLNAKLGINDSSGGTRVLNTSDRNSGSTGPDMSMASITRIKNLGSNGTPDVILFFGGVNDIAYDSPLGTFNSENAKTEVDLTSHKWDTFIDSYVCAIMRMKHYYPNAKIVCIEPLRNKHYYTDQELLQYSSMIKQVCNHYNVEYLELFDVVTPDLLSDVTHPNIKGMEAISTAVINYLLANASEIEKGDNIVYKINHDFDTATASQKHVKGVSRGSEFVEVISNVTGKIAVTMNGIDITSSCYENGILNISNVTGDVEIVEIEKFDFQGYLQELPEEVCSGTNLVDILKLDSGYFSGTNPGERITNYYSFTFNVNAGDKIYSNSFGKAGTNGSATTNGIRTNFFDDYGLVKTLTTNECYDEFTKNNGYLIVPENAKYVNVVFWTNTNNDVHILNYEHQYETNLVEPNCLEKGYNINTCTICNDSYNDSYVDELGHYFNSWDIVNEYNNPALMKHCDRCNEFVTFDVNSTAKGQVVSILGASTSTFKGYVPIADGFNLEHRCRYPQDNLLTDVNDTFWMQVINSLNMKLGINDSWAGSRVLNTLDTNSGDLGKDASLSSLTRIKNLGSNGSPDIIIVQAAGNDIGNLSNLGSFDPSSAPSKVDLTSYKWASFADAFVCGVLRLKHFYPNAKIIYILPGYMKSYYTNDELMRYTEVMVQILNHYEIDYVDNKTSGVKVEHLPDGIHPNAIGMDYMTNMLIDKITSYDSLETENIVYPIYHNLKNVEAEKFYYKGVSAGSTFTESITSSADVTILMDGIDITANCYSDGLIVIENVTGEIEINAEAKFDFQGRVEEITEHVCYNKNILDIVELKPGYFYMGEYWTSDIQSITMKVTPGEKIYANVFGTFNKNGTTQNGIRVTWFDDYGVVKTTSIEQTYAEFLPNGYLVVPEGATVVNIPFAGTESDFVLKNLTNNHLYNDGICTSCSHSILNSNWIKPAFAEGDYSLVVLPDTQIIIESHPEVYIALMQWIADNKDKYGIRAVMHMGDIVNTNTDAQWKVAKEGFDILDKANIANMPMMGNHDSSAYFNQYFDYETYGSSKSYFGGSYHLDKLDHTYWFVNANNREYVILSLGWAPSYDVLSWAEEVIKANIDKNIIINCHAYMNSDNTFLSKGDAHCVTSYAGLSAYPNGDDVWNTFKKYENVVLAMGGHISSPDVAKSINKNAANNDVYSLLFDNQNMDITDYLGMLGLLTFENNTDNVFINWYSTRYDAFLKATNQFNITVPHIYNDKCVVSFYNHSELYIQHLYEKGVLIQYPTNPTPLTGYKFIGWFTDEDVEWNIHSDCVYGDINLYAKYEELPEYYEDYVLIEESSQEKGPIISETGEMIAGSTTDTYTNTYENIDVSSGKIKVTGRVGSNVKMHLIAFFDKDGNLLGALEKSTGTQKYYNDYLIENVPFNWEDVYTIKLSGRQDSMPELKVMKLVEKGNYPKHTFNKTVAVFGGSISTHTYNSNIAQDIWDEYCGFGTITNYGVPGMGFAFGTESIPTQVEKAIADQKYDIYVLWCSTNDYRKGIPAGLPSDNPTSIKDITTQCGGINYSIRRILETNPNAKIYLFTSAKFFATSSPNYPNLGDSGYNPYSTAGAYDGKNFYYYVEKQKECALKNGIAYLDLYSLSGINEFNYKQYFKSDKLHFTEYGYQELGRLQAEFLYKGYSGGEDLQPEEVYIKEIILTESKDLIDTYTIYYSDGTTTTFTVTNGKDGAQGIQGIQGEPGKDGHTPVITIENGNWYIDGVNTGKSAIGLKGETGNGISSIEKTSTDGLVDTYTITFTNGQTTTFTVTNGKDGAQGIQGIQGIPGKDGHTPVITIENGNWYIDGIDTGKSAIGLKGETGNGISSIKLTNTEGLVDIYTITFTNGQTTTFTVTNGKDGAQGIQGIQGEPGKDGHTPVITIENGNWHIDGVDTGKSAIGLKGETGNGISSIIKTSTDGLVDTYTITFTNGQTTTFTVTNGKDGAQGIQGIQGIPGKDGHTPVITIENGNWYIDGVDTGKSAIGLKGDAGNGISSIKLTNTEGLVDTYTITFTNGQTTTFTVTNGKDGAQGIQGIQGEPGKDGHTPVITIENGNWYIDGVDTGKSASGLVGETGNGISSIIKTSTDGLVDTYTITFTNGQTTIFTVTNGKDGAQGIQGIQGIPGKDGHTPVITIENGNWYIDGVDTGKSAIGLKGDAGNGISSIKLTNTEGLVDTYTITFTDGTTTTFTVTNGKDGATGAQGIQGIQGIPGKDGHTPVITIVNGNWYIDGIDTGKSAIGLKGDAGNGISSIKLTNTEGLIDIYTITFTNGQTTTFTVTNGKDGAQGIQGIQGEPGKDGHTPVITIENGYWHIDGINTNVLAEGIKGETGNSIKEAFINDKGELILVYTDGTTCNLGPVVGNDGVDGAVIAAVAVGSTALVSQLATIAWLIIKKKKYN